MYWVSRGRRRLEDWAVQARLHKGSKTEALKHGQRFIRQRRRGEYSWID